MIKLKTMIEVETNVHTVSVNVKVSDRGSYIFKDDTGNVIKDFTENYVPDFSQENIMVIILNLK